MTVKFFKLFLEMLLSLTLQGSKEAITTLSNAI